MPARRQEALDDELAEARKVYRAHAAHERDVLAGELEGRRLEVDIAARRVGEEEPKVNVDDTARAVEQNVAIVAVLDLQQVTHDGPRRRGVHKVAQGAPVAPAAARAV